jgi:site-specific DNA-cytosine methylase
MIAAAWSTKLANTHSNQAGKFYEEYTPALAHNSPPPAVANTVGAGGHSNNPLDETLVAGAQRASDGHHGHSSPRGDGADNLIAWDDRNELSEDYFGPVRKGSGNNGAVPPAISDSAGVRRLTPRECERLMAFPDEWTRYTADGREISDSHRYRMCGNGVVATVAEWLGHRLVEADPWP